MSKKTVWPKLPEVFKTNWVAALRSKKYKQGEGALYLETVDQNTEEVLSQSFCCLGVAGCIQKVSLDQLHGCSYIEQDQLDHNDNYIPECIIGENELTIYLSQLNDGATGVKKKTFKGIATWIEKNL